MPVKTTLYKTLLADHRPLPVLRYLLRLALSWLIGANPTRDAIYLLSNFHRSGNSACNATKVRRRAQQYLILCGMGSRVDAVYSYHSQHEWASESSFS